MKKRINATLLAAKLIASHANSSEFRDAALELSRLRGKEKNKAIDVFIAQARMIYENSDFIKIAARYDKAA